MDKKYFYIKDNNRLGPYSIKQLANQNIKKNTLIWKDGLEDWVKASELKELKEIIIAEPPPIPKSSSKAYKTKVPKNFYVKDDIYDSDYEKEKWVSKMVILYIIVAGLISYSNFPFSESYITIASVFGLIIRIIAIIIISNIVRRQNRNVWGWGTFCLFFPQLALFIIGFQRKLKLKVSLNSNWSNIQKKNHLIKKGEKFYENYRYKEVVILMNKLLEINPQDEKGLLLRAECYYEIKEFNKALLDYKNLISISKNGNIRDFKYKVQSIELKLNL